MEHAGVEHEVERIPSGTGVDFGSGGEFGGGRQSVAVP
jgi:hypothetical protein